MNVLTRLLPTRAHTTPGPPLLPSIPTIAPTYGALLLGTFLSLILDGVGLHQAYRYARVHTSDGRVLKFYVAALVLVNLFHTILAVHASYFFLVENYFNPARLLTASWSLNVHPVIVGTVIVACQTFFACRVYLLGKQFRALVFVAGVMLIAEYGFSIAFSVKSFMTWDAARIKKLYWIQSSGFGIVVVVDIMLTYVLVFTLHRRRTNFKGTNSKIDVLIAYAICTGLITVFFSLVCFVTALAAPQDLIFVAADLVCTKVYVNSVLAALNLREIRPKRVKGEPISDAIDLAIRPRHESVVNITKDWPPSSSTTGGSTIDIKVADNIVAGV